MKAAVIQHSCSVNITENINRAFSLARQAKLQGADIVCFPEFFSYPWFPCANQKDLSLFRDDSTVEQSIRLAKELSLYLVITHYEVDGDKQYNTALIIDPEGQIIGKYRKNHLPQVPGFYEQDWYQPGDLGLPVFKTPIGTIGILVCSDVMYLQNVQIMKSKGAELIFNPRCVVKAGNYRWEQMLIANSIVSGCYILSANRTGQYQHLQFDGHSMIIEPGGKIIQQAEVEEDILIVDYDLNKVYNAQANYPCNLDPRYDVWTKEFDRMSQD